MTFPFFSPHSISHEAVGLPPGPQPLDSNLGQTQGSKWSPGLGVQVLDL